jgi:hypothetical protein
MIVISDLAGPFAPQALERLRGLFFVPLPWPIPASEG